MCLRHFFDLWTKRVNNTLYFFHLIWFINDIANECTNKISVMFSSFGLQVQHLDFLFYLPLLNSAQHVCFFHSLQYLDRYRLIDQTHKQKDMSGSLMKKKIFFLFPCSLKMPSVEERNPLVTLFSVLPTCCWILLSGALQLLYQKAIMST